MKTVKHVRTLQLPSPFILLLLLPLANLAAASSRSSPPPPLFEMTCSAGTSRAIVGCVVFV
jgi:hypothetical protein